MARRKSQRTVRPNAQPAETIGESQAQLRELAKAQELILPETPPRIRYKVGRQSALQPTEPMCNLLMNLAGEGYTQIEIAAFLGVHDTTLSRFLATHPEAREAIDRGETYINASLRRQQIKQALAGDATMLIWLGKQRLGQKDQRHVTASGTITHAVTVSETRAFLEQEAAGSDDQPPTQLVSH